MADFEVEQLHNLREVRSVNDFAVFRLFDSVDLNVLGNVIYKG